MIVKIKSLEDALAALEGRLGKVTELGYIASKANTALQVYLNLVLELPAELHNGEALALLDQRIRGKRGGCTEVWLAGSLAYRCRDCQTNESSAICCNCFQASQHEGHDYTLYLSPSGGCCDCGQKGSWKAEGCCQAHQLSDDTMTAADYLQLLNPEERSKLEVLLEKAFIRLHAEILWAANNARNPADKLGHFQGMSYAENLGQICKQPILQSLAAHVLTGGDSQGPQAGAEGESSSEVKGATEETVETAVAELSATSPPEIIGPSHQDLSPKSDEIPTLAAHIQSRLGNEDLEFEDAGAIAATAGKNLTPWRGIKAAIESLKKEECLMQGLPADASPERLGDFSFTNLWKNFIEHNPDPPSSGTIAREERLKLRSQESFLEGLSLKTSAELTQLCLDRAKLAFKSNRNELLLWLGYVHFHLRERVTTLLLGLLYDQKMTQQLSKVVLSNYDSLVLCMTKQAAEEHNRLHVQLFPTAETAVTAVKEMQALPAMTFTLKAILTLSTRSPHPPDDFSYASVEFHRTPLMEGNLRFQRVMQDLSALLHHREVIEHIRREPDLQTFGDLLYCLFLLTGMTNVRRARHQHVEYELPDWTAPCTVEVSLMRQGLGPIVSSLHPEEGDSKEKLIQKDEELMRLFEAAIIAITKGLKREGRINTIKTALSVAKREEEPEGEPVEYWDVFRITYEGNAKGQFSLHQPLLHLLGMMLHAMTLLRARLESPEHEGETSHELSVEMATSAISVGAVNAISVQGWLSQVSSGMWVRNGASVVNKARLYTDPYWANWGLDMDIVLLQHAIAGSDLPIMNVFGFTHLAWEDTESAELLQGRADIAHFFVSVLRCRWGDNEPGATMLRQDLLHILAEAPRTYSRLAFFAQTASPADNSSGLLTQILEKIADFHPPGNSGPGVFKLRKESWAEFNPFYHRMSRASLAKAKQNAMEAGWEPASQLTQLPPPPTGLRHLYQHLGSPALMTQIAFVLHFFVKEEPSKLDPQWAVSMMNLVGMSFSALQQKYIESNCADLMLPALLEDAETGRLSIMSSLKGIVRMDEESIGKETKLCAEASIKLIADFVGQDKVQRWVQDTDNAAADLASSKEAKEKLELERKRRAKQQQEEQMAKLRAEQLAALQMFSDDSDDDDDEEPDTAKDTQMEPEPESVGEGSSEKPVLPVKETGPYTQHENDCALCRGNKGELGLVVNVQPCCNLQNGHRRRKEFSPADRGPEMDAPASCCEEGPVFDKAMGLHVHCCGHRLHPACLVKYMRENDLSYSADDNAEEANDASGVVANYLGEFFCPTCRRISNALMPHFLELAPPQDNPLPPPRTGKRKLDADDGGARKAAAVREAEQTESHSRWSAEPDGCLFSQLAQEASLALSSSPNPGQDLLDNLKNSGANIMAVREFGSMCQKWLGEKYSLAISFTATCRRLLARAGIPEMQLNCTDVDATNRPNLTYLGQVFISEVVVPYRGLPGTQCAPLLWAILGHNIACAEACNREPLSSADSSVRAAQLSQAHVLRQLALLAVAAQPQKIPRGYSLRAALSAVAWLDGDDHNTKVDGDAAVPSICEALQQPRMVCDWQQDKYENDDEFHKFSKLPPLLTPIGRDVADEVSWDVRIYHKTEVSASQLSEAQNHEVISAVLSGDVDYVACLCLVAAANESVREPGSATAKLHKAKDVMGSPAASYSFTEAAMAKYVSLGIDGMRAHEEGNPEPPLERMELSPGVLSQTEREAAEIIFQEAAAHEAQRWRKMRVDFVIDSLLAFFEERVKEEELCITVKDDPITPFKRCWLVWDKLKRFLEIIQHPEAPQLEGVDPKLAATRYDVGTLTALYRCASRACARGMRDMRITSPEEDEDDPRLFIEGVPTTSEYIGYRSLIPDELQAEKEAYREDREERDCNERQPRLEDESSGICPGDLPSWRDIADDPYLLFLQLTMVAEGCRRQQIVAIMRMVYTKLVVCETMRGAGDRDLTASGLCDMMPPLLKASKYTHLWPYLPEYNRPTLSGVLRTPDSAEVAEDSGGGLEGNLAALYSNVVAAARFHRVGGLPRRSTLDLMYLSAWEAIMGRVMDAALTLLRRAEHLIQALFDSPEAIMSEWATFWEVSKDPGETEEEEQMWQKGIDLHRLTKKFCLPSINEAVEALVDHPQVGAVLRRWKCCHGVMTSGGQLLVPRTRRVQVHCSPQLIDLPNTYQELMLKWGTRSCSQCNRKFKDTELALCLLCGSLLCKSNVRCGRQKDETPQFPASLCRHAAKCGAGVCPFLLLKRTQLLVLSSSRAAFLPSPYLDAYGEEDVDLTRGKVLYKNADRWATFESLWRTAALEFDTKTMRHARGGRTFESAQAF